MVTTLFSTDGGQRKRKDDGELEGTPAKRKSVGNKDNSILGEVGEEAANALQNLQLANDTLKVQQNSVPGTVLCKSNANDNRRISRISRYIGDI